MAVASRLLECLRRAALIWLLAAATPALAVPEAGPTGDWLVAGRVALIRIVDCGGQLWGVVAWEKEPGVDTNNPDPAKRTRPTLGMPVLLGMTTSGPNQWDGHIYNSDHGRTYDGKIRLRNADVLRVEGCVLGLLCGGENWTRVAPPAAQAAPQSQQAICARL
jgi:uncharacterized protein (DUF2147 family)